MSAADVVTETVIDRPRADIAAYVIDADNATAWYRNITSVAWETEKPARIGSRIAFVARFLGRMIAYTCEVRELVPGERLVMSTSQGPFPMETTYTWADEPRGAMSWRPLTRPNPTSARSRWSGSSRSGMRTAVSRSQRA